MNLQLLPINENLKSTIYHIFLIIILMLFSGNNITAGTIENDPDQMFIQAREFVSENNFEKALPILNQILDKHPNYYDATILKARIHAWQGQHNTARDLLISLLEQSPGHSEAIKVMIDVEMWSKNHAEAIKYIDKALADQPDDTDLLFRKATALHESGDDAAALEVLNQILEIDPNNQEAQDLKEKINIAGLKTSLGVGYRGHYFIEVANTNPWHLYYAELGRKSKVFGRIIARVNIAQRHNLTGAQAELDAYPVLRHGTYLYLNLGYSPNRELFPITRFGLEIFQALPAAMEVSAGARLLNFQYKNLLILTGSLSKFAGKYYFSFRPYFPFSNQDDAPSGQSFFLTIRRHFSSEDHYISLLAGRGFSVDMERFMGGQIYDLGGTLADAMLLYQQPINNNFIFRVGVGYKMYDDELSVVPFGDPLVISGGLTYRF